MRAVLRSLWYLLRYRRGFVKLWREQYRALKG